MFSARSISLVTITFVVALATATALRFKDEAVPLFIPDSPVVGERTSVTKFSCNLLSEVDFSYPEFSGWRITAGESSTVDGKTSCVLDVAGETEEDQGEVVIEKQIYTADSMPPVSAPLNRQSVPYVYVVSGTQVSDEVPPSSNSVAFYSDRAVYSVHVSSLNEIEFPVDAFLTDVIVTFKLQ